MNSSPKGKNEVLIFASNHGDIGRLANEVVVPDFSHQWVAFAGRMDACWAAVVWIAALLTNEGLPCHVHQLNVVASCGISRDKIPDALIERQMLQTTIARGRPNDSRQHKSGVWQTLKDDIQENLHVLESLISLLQADTHVVGAQVEHDNIWVQCQPTFPELPQALNLVAWVAFVVPVGIIRAVLLSANEIPIWACYGSRGKHVPKWSAEASLLIWASECTLITTAKCSFATVTASESDAVTKRQDSHGRSSCHRQTSQEETRHVEGQDHRKNKIKNWRTT